MSDKGLPLEEYSFQILKPIILKKGEPTIGHISSNVRNNLLEEEIERLKKRIKELEKELSRHPKKAIFNQDDEDEDFFKQLAKESRRRDERSKRSNSRSRNS